MKRRVDFWLDLGELLLGIATAAAGVWAFWRLLVMAYGGAA